MGEKSVCAWCYFARMRRDVCGTYCTGGFENKDGSCDKFKSWQEHKKELREKRKQRINVVT